MRISDWSSDVCSSDLLPGSQHGSATIRSRVQAPIIPRMANPPKSPSPNPPLPDASGPVAIAGPAGALELHVDLPDDDVAPLPLIGLVCHPLPTEGGTMHNQVVRSETHTSELPSLMRL